MDTNQIVQLIVAILTGLATCIPLAVKLVEYVKTATKEKNWANLLVLVMSLMEQAERSSTTAQPEKNGSWLWLRLRLTTSITL